MGTATISSIAWAILRGLLFFGVVMGASVGLVTLNARNSPDLIWFPLPIAAVMAAAAWWAQRRWNIGLGGPLRIPAGQAILLSIAVLAVGDAACVLQGAYHGMVRDREFVADAVGPAFQVVYFFALASLSAVLAEVTFRGIVQTRLHQLLSPWAVIVLVAALNTVSHRWNDELAHQWLGFLVSLSALCYLRWRTGSLWPPLLVHLVDNVLMAASLWHWGPLEQGALSRTALAAIGALGLIGCGVIRYLARLSAERPPVSPPLPAAR